MAGIPRIRRTEDAMPSDSLDDENYQANDNQRADDSVSKHFVSPQKYCYAISSGITLAWTT
jgi:hypothetical protein